MPAHDGPHDRLSPELPFRSGPAHRPSSVDAHPLMRISSSDPRCSSTQSLTPFNVPLSDIRRKLLLVYIHGFYGTSQSFKSFPAHVHSLLCTLLAESHVIHSKIYPRYKTYHAIEVARDNFSAWIEPHESPTTDVILVGHSMGGLLAAEVVLMPKHGADQPQAFKHRVLGTVSLDSPFLGLHPGIVSSGLASLFQPGQQPANDSVETLATCPSPPSSAGASPSSTDLPLSMTPSLISPPRETDPHFDPPFWNDKPFQEQPFLNRLVRFAAKHRSEGIFRAVQNHVASHLEFGGCLADFSGLVSRYNKLRKLEDIDEILSANNGHSDSLPQVRFVNYYTLSSGRPKLPKNAPSEPRNSSEAGRLSLGRDDAGTSFSSINEGGDLTSQGFSASKPLASVEDVSRSGVPTPRVSVEVPDGDERRQQPNCAGNVVDSQHGKACKGTSDEPELETSSRPLSEISLQHMEARPMEESEPLGSAIEESEQEGRVFNGHPQQQSPESSAIRIKLPPLPEEPSEPVLPDLEQYTDKDARKQAEKEGKRTQKAYEQAVKARAKAVREREKIMEKRRKAAQKELQRQQKDALKAQQRLNREKEKAAAAAAATPAPAMTSVERDTALKAQADKPRKNRKFCTLPRKSDGVRDPTWVDVYMDGMDEVGAHSGLFVPGPHYDGLVGDVAGRIVKWVFDDMSKRTILNGLE